MFRLLITTFYLLGLFLFESILQEPVSLSISAPAEVVAGTEFQMKVTLDKRNLDGFSRFMQSLPAGLTATAATSSNADFTFDEKRVRLIWLKLPKDEQVQFTYNIKVDQRLKGNFTVNGVFSYIESNERKSVTANPLSITINPSPDINPDLIVDINDFEKSVIPNLNPRAFEQIVAVRQDPIYNKDKNQYIINLLVNKQGQQKFAKIEESIPDGYTAVNIEGKDAIFTFRDNTVKYLWMNLPPEPNFVVSYKLIPNQGTNLSSPSISGEFSYITDDKTQIKPVATTSHNLANLNSATLSMVLQGLSPDALTESKTNTNLAQADNTSKINKPPKKTSVREENKVQAIKKASKPKPIDRKFLLEPKEGVYYRVQIAAGKKPVNVKRYFKKLPFTEDVRAEFHEGWHKYSVGSYKEYKEARDLRVHIWNTTVIHDAFVSAYNDGKRITVQEALMIANQQWYK